MNACMFFEHRRVLRSGFSRQNDLIEPDLES
jgi:hypothetical protein